MPDDLHGAVTGCALHVRLPGKPARHARQLGPGWHIVGDVQVVGGEVGALAAGRGDKWQQLVGSAVVPLPAPEVWRALICATAPLLYGRDWIVPLSRELRVPEADVRRWASRDGVPSPDMVHEVAVLASARIAALLGVASLAGPD